MAKKNKQDKKVDTTSSPTSNSKSKPIQKLDREYLWCMSRAPRITDDIHWFQLLIISFFTAFIIMIVRMKDYKRPMEQFYWSGNSNDLTDFFSYYKMVAILICASIILLLLMYRIFSQSLAIKRNAVYIPMALYAVMVLISYSMSDYKDFAWLGWNDRFEGTVVLLSYMLILFYIINSINTEKAVKWVIYPLAVSSTLLSLIGISQATGHDFFRTNIGQKLIVPNILTSNGHYSWELIDQASATGKQFLEFIFQHNEIYQTVYNINYVSFYLTLLIPIFGLLFIYAVIKGTEEKAWKKITWGILFALLIFNLIGSASSGGFFGMAIVVLLAIILLNKKILLWWKPLIALIAITLLVGGLTHDRWLPELSNTFKVMHSDITIAENKANTTTYGHLDYIQTKGDNITVGYNGDSIIFHTNPDSPSVIEATDFSGKKLSFQLSESGNSGECMVKDERFNDIKVRPAVDSSFKVYVIIKINDVDWTFLPDQEGVKYVNGLGKYTSLEKTPAKGWEDNQAFGSGRGYIWSRTLPMMKETALIGHGADTYCIYFPQNDYVGKYNSGTFTSNINIIVDKPHNMYMGMWVGTGGISTIAFLALLLLYFIQSVRVFWKRNYDNFVSFTGLGIFLGVMGFAFTGFVDDSSVSVMPMFYGLLGTGIAINMILRNSKEKNNL